MITSLKNQLIKDTVKLYQKKERTKQQKFLIEGMHLLEEAQKKGIVDTIFTTDKNLTGEHVIHVNEMVMEKLSATKSTTGVVAICDIPTKQQITGNVVILQEVQDPGNVGTILRSAVAFGYETVIVDHAADVYSDKVVRSTQGAIFHLHIIHQDTETFMKENPHYHIYGTSLDGTPLEQIKPLHPHALLLGNEGSGVAPHILKNTNENITIEMNNMESLNVAVAGSILMYHLRK